MNSVDTLRLVLALASAGGYAVMVTWWLLYELDGGVSTAVAILGATMAVGWTIGVAVSYIINVRKYQPDT